MNGLHEWARRTADAICKSVKEWEAKTGRSCPVVLPDAKIDIPMPAVVPPPIMEKDEDQAFCDICNTRAEVVVLHPDWFYDNAAGVCICRECLKKALEMLGEKS